MFDFLHFRFVDVIDILLVAVIIFICFKRLRHSSAFNIFLAIVFLYVLRFVVSAFGMKLMTALVRTIMDVGMLAIVVLFQPEIRKFLFNLGSGNGWVASVTNKLLGITGTSVNETAINEICEACEEMSKDRTGALMVLLGRDSLQSVVASGDIVDARVSKRLLMNLFFKNSPLHDGAVIIDNSRVVAARCTLPFSTDRAIPASFGMRHKAAIGISEESDATVVLVSEETGHICFVCHGDVTIIDDIEQLRKLLGEQQDNEGRIADKT